MEDPPLLCVVEKKDTFVVAFETVVSLHGEKNGPAGNNDNNNEL